MCALPVDFLSLDLHSIGFVEGQSLLFPPAERQQRQRVTLPAPSAAGAQRAGMSIRDAPLLQGVDLVFSG